MNRIPIMSRLAAALNLVVRGSGVPAAWFNRAITSESGPNQFTQPYANSVWVQAAIKKVASPISAVELCLYDEADEEIEDPRLAAFWRAPALHADGSRMGGADFLELCASWLCLSGEIFFILDDTWALPFPEVDRFGGYTPLIIARPDRMRPLKSVTGPPGWEFTDANGRRKNLPAESVLQIKLFNPYDDIRGLGPLQAALIAAGGDYAAGTFAKNTAEANGDQGVYIIAKNGMITDEQRDQIISQLREKRFAQQRGIFRPAFLTGDITIEDPKVRSVDVSFLGQRVEARKEIAIAFGVPPSFFEPVASYSIGAASDRYILIEETCKPLGVKICGGLSRIATRLRGTPVVCELDWDDHSVMQAVRRERIDAGLKLWNTGMPMTQVSDYLNLDLPDYPGSDIGYLPFNLAPAGESGSDASSPLTAPDYAEPPVDPIAEMRRALQVGRVTPCAPPSDFQRKRPAREVATWKDHQAKRRPIVKAYESRFNRVLLLARAEVLKKLASHSASLPLPAAPAQRAVAADFMFSLDGFNSSLQAVMRNMAATALQSAGEQFFAEIGKDDPWTTPSADVIAFVKQRENKLSGVADEVWHSVRDKLQAGLTAGDPLNTIADSIRAQFNDISKGRARVIAMTETGAAYGSGRDLAMKAAGIQFKQWLTSGNSNVRPAHADANGQTVGVAEKFNVDGEELAFPGDPSGSPGNVINCHCVAISVTEPPPDPNV